MGKLFQNCMVHLNQYKYKWADDLFREARTGSEYQ